MSDRCSDLDPFFDRELEPAAAQEFRDHLATCTDCQDALHGRMLEAVLLVGERARPTSSTRTPTPPARSSMRPTDTAPVTTDSVKVEAVAAPEAAPGTEPVERIAAIAAIDRFRRRARALRAAALFVGSLTAAAAALLVVVRPGTPPGTDALSRADELVLADSLAPERNVEVRFSAPALDHYRRFHVDRDAGPAPTEQITLQILSRLQTDNRMNALVGARALVGDLSSARQAAKQLPRTASGLIDLSAIELLRARTIPDPPAQAAVLWQAMSLATEALRLEPGRSQARWNRAIALRELGLPELAASTFEEIASAREPGWADEAKERADQLHQEEHAAASAWDARIQAGRQMTLGGPVLSSDEITNAPSFARDQLYLAIATAATPERLDALLPVARSLDVVFSTTVMSDLLHRVQRSDLAARAPLSSQLQAALQGGRHRDALVELRGRAVMRGVPDIALAAFLALSDRNTEASDISALDRIFSSNHDPWWQLVRLARSAFIAEFTTRDRVIVDSYQRRSAPICATMHSAWCGRIIRLAAGANSQMGRMDLALSQFIEAKQIAEKDGTNKDQIAAAHALGEAFATWVSNEVDSATVSAAFLQEVSLQNPKCETRLYQLDFATMSALRYHRLDDAEHAQHDADVLEHGECHAEDPRLNEETGRVRLLLQGRSSVDLLRASLAKLEINPNPIDQIYLEFLAASATLLDDRSRGEAALQQVIDRADANPAHPHSSVLRSLSYDVLVDSAVDSHRTDTSSEEYDRAATASKVLTLLTRRLGAPTYDRCVLGIASWNRLVLVARDAHGTPTLETREIPPGKIMIPPSEVVSPELRARLAGCPRIEVLAPGPYFGAPQLLGDQAMWIYHSGHPRIPTPAATPRELVISDVTPPQQLHLPTLRPFVGGPNSETLSGPAATPESVLDKMKAANLLVIVAHGVTDASEPNAASLVLTPNAQGDYLLTASKVSSVELTGAPIVILAGCDAGRVQLSAEPWSLATSFIRAGARVVIAPTEPIPDEGASVVFRALVDRIRVGADPVDALAAERQILGATAPWLSSIVVFE